jgi:hypothetical protein
MYLTTKGAAMKTVLVHDRSRNTPENPDRTSRQPPVSAHTQIRAIGRVLPGAILTLVGSLVLLSGVGLLFAFGTDGRLTSGPRLLSTPAGAIVSPVATIKNTSGVATLMGQPTLRISASPTATSPAAFVGIAPATDVNRYLTGVATEHVSDLGFDASTTGNRQAGRTSAQPPSTQPFWVAQASSTHTARIDWKIKDGNYRVVVMNANGHGGIAATSTITTTLPNMPLYALLAVILGVVITAGGTLLIVKASRPTGDRIGASEPQAPAPASAAR